MSCKNLLVLLTLVLPLSVNAQNEGNAGNAGGGSDPTQGFQFTTGIGMMKINGGDISSSVVDNGVVRITGMDKSRLGFWAAAHSFASFKSFGVSGPFFGVQLGGENNKLVNSFAIGWSWTSAYSSKQSPWSAPLVFSVGVASSTRQEFAKPYADGEPIPAGSSQPLMKRVTAYGPVMVVSYRFGAN